MAVLAARHEVDVATGRISYQEAGPRDGDPIVLLHGLLSDNTTWDALVAELAERGLRVFAIDLLGHGLSSKPRGLYLLDDFALTLDEFLTAVGVASATICGHSLGGAIAVHFAYHYPHRVGRLVLVSAGGLGKEVSPALRMLALPGAERVVGAVMDRRPVQKLLRARWPYRLMRITEPRMAVFRRIGRSLLRPEMRAPFFASLRGVIAPAGQRGSFLEMEYLAAHVPTLVAWSSRDGIIPVKHAHATHAHLPDSRLVVFPDGGHEPHRRHAAALADAIASFVAEMPASVHPAM